MKSFAKPLFLALFLASLVLLLEPFNKISTSFDTLLREKKELLTPLIQNKLFVAVKGFDESSLKRIKDIEASLLAHPNITKFTQNHALNEHKKEFALYIYELKNLTDEQISLRAKELKEKLIDADIFFSIDPVDPLGLTNYVRDDFSKFIKNGQPILPDYGYLGVFEVSDEVGYDEFYEFVQSLKSDIAFSPLFYFSENSKIIKNDVNKIITLSFFVMAIFFLLLIKNKKLLFLTLSAISFSAVFALCMVSILVEQISIFTVVFGFCLSGVAVDYMFHYYFSGYLNEKKNRPQEVFLGMITTVFGFFVLSFVGFELIFQLCWFAIFSLVSSFIIFSTLFSSFDPPKKCDFNLKTPKIKASLLFVFTLVALIFLSLHVEVDLDLKNLDVKNSSLEQTKEFFYQKLSQKDEQAVLFSAPSITKLIEKSRSLRSELSPLALCDEQKSKKVSQINQIIKDSGFKNGLYKDVPCPTYTLQSLNELGISVQKVGENYQAIGFTKDTKGFEKLSTKELFEDELKSIYFNLVIVGVIFLVVLSFIFWFYNKKRFIVSLLFILFPLSVMMCVGLFAPLNILNIFMMIIILSLSVDFAFYVNSNHSQSAIYCSLISTFAGFGVLVFSSLNALFSIGLSAIWGIVAILFLMIFVKRGE